MTARVVTDDNGNPGPCPACNVRVGVQHGGSCENARCLATGLKRLNCKRYSPEHCGRDMWLGLVHGLAARGREWDAEAKEWFTPPPPPHPNRGECLSTLKGRVCGGDAPKYGNGFDERGASPLCFECQELLKTWKAEQRELQKGNKK